MIGYTNASWTLKVDMAADYVCRLLNEMDRRGVKAVTPRAPSGEVQDEGILDSLRAGYRIESVLNHDCFRSQPPEIVADFGKIVTEARTSGRTPGGDNSEAVLRCGA